MEEPKVSTGYPKAVYFVLAHQVFERFSFWGINVILPFFLQNVLNFDDDTSTAIYHGYSVFNYLSALIGAIVADSWLGKYRTIMYFSIVYILGTFLISFSSTEILSSGLTLASTMVGLLLTGLAAGSIKPCITAFGGDQFVLPEQEKQLKSYFPLLYLMVNLSLFVTAIIMPILRRDVSCFGENRCYPLAFVVPVLLIMLATVTLWMGRNSYKHVMVNGNVVGKALKCIKVALREKFCSKQIIKKAHWLEYADAKYTHEFIQSVKAVLGVLVLFIPVIIFWAVYEQQFSRWAFQAERMNGEVGSYSVAPDQVATLNFVLTFTFIPVFEKLVFPALSKCNLLTKPMHRVVTGFICSTTAFVVCGIVELKIENSSPNTVHMVWLLPQYILMSLAEVMLIPSINSFAYSEAPKSMKSILLMSTLIPQALGSVIVIVVAKGKLFEKQSIEFFFFAGINTCATILLVFLVMRYKSQNTEGNENLSEISSDKVSSTTKEREFQDNHGVDNISFIKE